MEKVERKGLRICTLSYLLPVFLITFNIVFLNWAFAESYMDRVNSFKAMEKYKNGAYWDDNYRDIAYLGWGCNAYVRDFAHYCWPDSPDNFLTVGQVYYTDPAANISDGDIIFIDGYYTNSAGQRKHAQHWYAVIKRIDDNTLWTIEGNASDHVRESKTQYTIAKLGDGDGIKTFNRGYHMPGYTKYSSKKELRINAGGGSVTGAGQYKPGTMITITATPDEYHSFSSWSSSVDGILANANSSTTSITMPESDVTLAANFKLKMGSVTQSWENISASATKNNVSLSATLSVDAATLGFGIACPVSVSNAFLVISPDSNVGAQAAAAITGSLGSINAKNLYMKQFDVQTPSSSSILGGKRYKYAFSISNTNQLKNTSGTTLTLSPSTTYYYSWMATVNNKSINTGVKSFTTKAAGTLWGTPSVDSNGYFYDWVYYNKSSISVPEVGIFVGTDENIVKNITTNDSVPNGVEKRTDKNNVDSAYDSAEGATYVFYKPAGFTKIAFNPGVSYYYKFYSIDADGDVVYSTVAKRDIPGTVETYLLTVKAGNGGRITTEVNGSYAAGNVISIGAEALTGYTFKGWSSTAGSIATPSSANTSFTMPAKAVTVTASFEQNNYSLNATAYGGGTITLSKHSELHYGEVIHITAIPKEGYAFNGWSSNNGGSFSDVASTSTEFTMPAGNVSLFADFVKIEFDISASSNMGVVLLNCESASMGTNVSVTAVANEGAKFIMWESSDVVFDNFKSRTTAFTMPSHSVTIKAFFELVDLYESREKSNTIILPERIMRVEQEAFSGVNAKFFVVPESIKVIENNSFPANATVYLTHAEEISIEPHSIAGNGTYVEMSDKYDFSFAERLMGTSNKYVMRDGSIPGEWSPWSDWSEIATEAQERVEVETKTQYRSAPVTYSDTYSTWSDWSSWSYTRQSITNNSLKEEKTRQVYPYYYFVCPNCGGHLAYWGSRTCDLCGKSVNILESSFDIDIDHISVSKSECSKLNSIKYYTVFNGQRYFYWDDGSSPSQQTIKTQYSYKTRTISSIPSIGTYGAWQDEQILESGTVSVQTRTVYRYRTRK